jgi:AcrR family transcriptional regulator
VSIRVFPGPIWTQPAPGSRKPRFTRDQIAEIAIGIADREGFDALSMRRIAEELDAGTMTLYHYVRTKDDLVELMNDALMGEILVPANELSRDWREALAQIARASFQTFRRHAWALSALRGARFGPNSLAHFEQSLAALARAPFPYIDRLDVIGIVDDFVYGFVRGAYERILNEEFTDDVPTGPLLDFLQERLDSGLYPQLRAMIGGSNTREQWARVRRMLDHDQRFERGLGALIDGLARAYAPRSRSRATRGRSSAGARRRR